MGAGSRSSPMRVRLPGIRRSGFDRFHLARHRPGCQRPERFTLKLDGAWVTRFDDERGMEHPF
jgi:hypothetical protein